MRCTEERVSTCRRALGVAVRAELCGYSRTKEQTLRCRKFVLFVLNEAMKFEGEAFVFLCNIPVDLDHSSSLTWATRQLDQIVQRCFHNCFTKLSHFHVHSALFGRLRPSTLGGPRSGLEHFYTITVSSIFHRLVWSIFKPAWKVCQGS